MTDLYPHNQAAYDAVMAHYAAGHRKAAVVHATGTGKSYIIASVASHYNRVLVVAPNNFVLNETRKVCHTGCTFRSYASVMYNTGDANAYDLIVLDEFHRGGSDKWGIGVQQIIEANPNALLLGTSATHIRYLDGQRNMADELFDGQIVSHLPLKDAIEQGILPNPTYVSSIYTMDDIIRSRRQQIAKSIKKDIDRDDMCRRLDGIAHNWDNAGGVPHIFRKYLSHDMQRIIVFCSKVKRAAEARKLLSKWFGLAGFSRVRYYNIDYKEKRLEKEMNDFQQPLGEYDLKVAISVNMLNEGVHVPHVDGVIMLRTTISRIIIEQQVGRCLTSNNTSITPVVLDLVNNMDIIQYDEPVFTGTFTAGDDTERKERVHHGFPFHVIDECRDLRVLLQQLDNEIDRKPSGYWTLERCKADALNYNQTLMWRKHSLCAYTAAARNGWVNECCSHMKVLRVRRTFDECYADAQQYKTIMEWRKNSPTIYGYAKSKGWVQACAVYMNNHAHTLEECKQSALKFNRRGEWNDSKTEGKFCNYARSHGWYEECCAHMLIKAKRRTKEECMKAAKQFSSRQEWSIKDRACYDYARRKGWLDECTKHMKLRPRNITKEDCIESSSKYKYKVDWFRNFRSHVNAARRNGWYEECTAHMVPKPYTKK